MRNNGLRWPWQGAAWAALAAATAGLLCLPTGQAQIGGAIERPRPTPTLDDISSDSVVVVASGATDSERGANLLAAWEDVSALTPNGAALGADNWATLVLPPGRYLLTESWVADTSYIRIVGLTPGGAPGLLTGYAGDPYANPAYASGAVVTRATGGCTVQQTADYLHMLGFAIENTGSARTEANKNELNDCALVQDVGGGGCANSYYSRMLFRTPNGAVGGTSDSALAVPVTTADTTQHLNGLFEDSVCDKLGWWPLPGRNLLADFERCSSTSQAWGGHSSGSEIRGTINNCHGDNAAFGGCGTGGCDIASQATIRNCTSGDTSFAMGFELAGECIDCHGGEGCFAGTDDNNATTTRGKLTGLCLRCTSYGGTSAGDPFGAGGLRDSGDWATAGDYSCIEGGTLLDCEARTVQRTVACKASESGGTWQGARLENTYWQCTGSNVDAITLLDSLSEIVNCTVLVDQDGAGIPIVSQAYDIQAATIDDGGVFSDWSGGKILPATEAVGDAFYILLPPGGCKQINFANPDVEGVYAGDSLVWEYYSADASDWAALAGVDDDTETGENGDGAESFERDAAASVSWDWPAPDDFAPTTIDGTKGYWIRLRVTAANITTIPEFTDGLVDMKSDHYRVRAVNCRFNNADTDADGLGSTVTNSVASPANTVFNSPSAN